MTQLRHNTFAMNLLLKNEQQLTDQGMGAAILGSLSVLDSLRLTTLCLRVSVFQQQTNKVRFAFQYACDARKRKKRCVDGHDKS